MNLSMIKTGITNIMKTPIGAKLVAHAPQILFGTGVATVIGSVGYSIYGGVKAASVLETTSEKVDILHEDFEEKRIDQKEESHELLKVYLGTGIDLMKIFWPTVVLTTVAVGCLTKSHGILTNRNAALVAAYSGLEKTFDLYRKRVYEEPDGEQKDRLYARGTYLDRVEVEETNPETGRKKKSKKVVEVLPWEEYEETPYRRVFDEKSCLWQPSLQMNLVTLKHVQNMLNRKLKDQGYIFLGEVWDELGLSRTTKDIEIGKAGAALGWVLEENSERVQTSNYVDFGIFEIMPDGEATIVDLDRYIEMEENGAGPIVIQFNPDGIVYDLLK